MTKREPEFLDVDEVAALHDAAVERFGGRRGLRDRGLLESAVAMPKMQMFGEFLHVGLYEMAAAYLFHIIKDHAFMDGNKRTGFIAAITFLRANGVRIRSDEAENIRLTMSIEDGGMTKAQAALWFSVHAR